MGYGVKPISRPSLFRSTNKRKHVALRPRSYRMPRSVEMLEDRRMLAADAVPLTQSINGANTEDFETGDFSKFPWNQSGSTDWTITSAQQHGGTYSSQAGSIADFQTSTLEVTLTTTVAGNVSFWRKVSSESNFDNLTFFIDGARQGEWSGEVSWGQVAYAVPAGNHTFSWEYSKDGSESAGADTAWVDDIEFPTSGDPAPTVTSIQPAPESVISSGSLDVNVTFSEAVLGVDASDLELSGAAAATATVGTPSHLGGNTWRFPVTGIQVGSVNLNLARDAGDIRDATGQDLASQAWSYTAGIVAVESEGFETGDFNKFPWQRSGDANWTITTSQQHSGTYSARSGDIDDSDTSTLELTLTTTAAGNISFWRKVSTETNYDYLRFFIDGTQQGQWSGELAWRQVTYAVPAGNHTFSWEYVKDGSVSNGSDTVWIDDLVLPPIGDAAPAVTRIDPAPGSTINSPSLDVNITFSEAVLGIDVSDLELSGAAAGAATVATPSYLGSNTWRFPITGLVDGTLNLSLAPDANDIQDAAGQDVPNQVWSYTVNTSTIDPVPMVTQIQPAPGSEINSGTLDVRVTFSEAVLGVDASDLALSGAAAGAATVGTPTNQGGNTWRFPITGIQQGALNLSLAPDAGDIEDAAGQDLANQVWAYTARTTSTFDGEDFETGNFSKFPWGRSGNADWTITSEQQHSGTYSAQAGNIDDFQTSTLEVNLTTVAGEISFWRKVSSESNFDFFRFFIDGTRQGQWSGEASWRQETYAVSAGNHTFSWEYAKDGSVSAGSDTAWIDDIEFPQVGNPAPTVTNINPAPGSTLGSGPFNVNVTFSKAVQGVDASDLELSGAAASAATVGTPTHQGGNTWRFPITGTQDGTLNLSLAPDANDIEDAAGQDLANEVWSYTVTTPIDPFPTVIQIDPAPGSSIGAGPLEVNVTFSEAVQGVDASDLELSGAAASAATVGTPTHQGSNTWRFPITGIQGGTLNVSLAPDAGDIEDAAGQDVANETWSYTVPGAGGFPGEDFETGNFSKFPWSRSGNADWAITSDQQHGGTYSAQAGNIDDFQNSTLELTTTTEAGDFSFWRKVSSESGFDFFRFYIDGTQRGEWFGEASWRQVTYTIPRGNHTFSWEYSKDGSVSAGSDTAWIDDIEFPRSSHPAPTVTGIHPAPGSAIDLPSVNVDVTFSEVALGVDASDLELSGAAAGAATVGTPTHVGGNTWRFPITELVEGTLNLSLAPDANDIENTGGQDVANEVWNYTVTSIVDPVPTIIGIDPAPGSSIDSGLLDVNVTFSETVQRVDASDLELSGAAAGGATVGAPSFHGSNTWRFPITGLVDGTLNLSLAPDANDIEDTVGQDVANEVWSYTVTTPIDPVPTVTGIDPVPGSSIGSGSLDVNVTFSEAVQGVGASDLELSGAAAGGATVSTPTHQGSNTWRFPITGIQGGTLNLSLAPDAGDIEDSAGQDVANETWSYTVPTSTFDGEDFETGNFTKFPWARSGSADWTITSDQQHGGTYSAQAGNIGDFQTSTLEVTLIVAEAGDISFWRKVSSESGFDNLTFSIDGTRLEQWSGDEPWGQVTYAVPFGEHTFTWGYSKDGSASDGSDTAWLDDIEFPPIGDPAPMITHIDPVPTSTISSGPLNVNVTFSEPVQGVDASDLVLGGAASGGTTVGNPTNQGGNTWRFPITGVVDGALTLSLAPDADDIQDALGQDLANEVWSYTATSFAGEDFETGDFSQFPWVRSGNANWTITSAQPHNGTYGAQSGSIGHSQTTTLKIAMATTSGGFISFWRKVSSEPNFDFFRFSVDGTQRRQWSGEVPWGHETYPVSPGAHTFSWEYSKDGATVSGSDAAWLDDIFFQIGPDTTPPTVSVVNPAPDARVNSSTLHVDVTFSEPVQNVDASDLVLSGVAAAAATVGTVTNQGDDTWRFTIRGLVDGPLNLSLAADSGDIVDPSGNVLAPESWSYTVSLSGVLIVPNYTDDANEGFFDPNLGPARRQAFEYALDIWEELVGLAYAGQTITVDASMDPLGGSSSGAVLGSAGVISIHKNRPGMVPETWYGAPLANQIFGEDIFPDLSEIEARFNSDVDNGTVLGSQDWYYGLDAQPGNDFDFVTVVLHEVGHGLNFFDLFVENGSYGEFTEPGIYDAYLETGSGTRLIDMGSATERAEALVSNDLWWGGTEGTDGNGGTRPKIYAPDPYRSGSSTSHVDESVHRTKLMSPTYSEANHEVSALELGMMLDMGWLITPPGSSPVYSPRPVVGHLGSPESLTIDRRYSVQFHLPSDASSTPSDVPAPDLRTIAAGVESRTTAVDALMEEMSTTMPQSVAHESDNQYERLTTGIGIEPAAPAMTLTVATRTTANATPDEGVDGVLVENWEETLDALTLDLATVALEARVTSPQPRS